MDEQPEPGAFGEGLAEARKALLTPDSDKSFGKMTDRSAPEGQLPFEEAGALTQFFRTPRQNASRPTPEEATAPSKEVEEIIKKVVAWLGKILWDKSDAKSVPYLIALPASLAAQVTVSSTGPKTFTVMDLDGAVICKIDWHMPADQRIKYQH